MILTKSIGINFFGRDTIIRKYHLQLARVLLSIFTLSTISAGLIYAAEHVVNPMLCDIPTALYFVATTVTTVGFGDVLVVTAIGRMIVCAMILAGAAIIPLQLSQFVDALLDFRRDILEKEERKKKKKKKQLMALKSSQGNKAGTLDDSFEQKAYVLKDVMQPDGTYKRQKTNKLVECPICHVKPHIEKAAFCWSCGAPLNTKSDFFLAPC